nr:hypothetical protein BHI3_09400 [Bacteriovorax sp. HI3]
MNKILIILALLTSLISCASASRSSDQDKIDNETEILDRAESNATPGGRKILEVSRSMIADQDVVVGGCWDYINAVYDRAGYPSNQRITVYKSKFEGPYAKTETFEAGDWLYFVNHSYRDIEHSAIFVAWINEAKKEALMVNYIGGKKKKPGSYKRFILDNVYNVFRTRE